MARDFDSLVSRRSALGVNPYEAEPIPRRSIQDIPDPATDTFIDRFRPLSSDPAGDYQKEQRFELQRRMQEIEKGVPIYRPGTPRFGDPTKVISQAATGTASDALPPGFSYADEAPKGGGLPPGFSYADETVPPAQLGGAARGTVGRREGPVTDAISNFLPQVGAGIKAGFSQFMRDAGGKLQEPEDALPAALGGPLAPGIAAMRGGAAFTRALSEGGFSGVDQAATGRMVQGAVGPGSTRLSTVADLKSPEDAIGRIVNLARTGGPEDLKAIAQLRKVIPAEKHAEVQAALVQKLGQGDGGEFAAEAFVRNYGQVSSRAKNILFGQGGLRSHLDSIAEVTERAPSWRGPTGRTMAGAAGAASLAGGFVAGTTGAIAAPLVVLSGMIPAKVLASALTSPATAASVAAWSRAYERVVRSGGNAALVSFNIATRNLNNTLGTDVGGK